MKAVNHEYYVSLEVAKLLKKTGFYWKRIKIMKNVFIFGVIITFLMSCQMSEPRVRCSESHASKQLKSDLYVVEIDSCEYIVFSRHAGRAGGMGGICHKENCKYCNQRKNQ